MTSALNFDTVDCRVEGSCDLYTTKAAGGDRKLYKNIEHSLESQYESLLRFSASLSPPEADKAGMSLNLSRSSPFGSLSQISSRRTFAYLIATLNASHPDYDFSYDLKPSNFRRERNLRHVMNTLDTTLYNLWPRPAISYGSPHWSSAVTPASTANPSQRWGPKMWRHIDKEMDLKACSIYTLAPEQELFDEEEGVIWTTNYFFFNKALKRVCYIYLKGLSIINNADAPPKTPLSDASGLRSSSGSNIGGGATTDWAAAASTDSGAGKRARFWLGDRGPSVEVEGGWDEDDDDEMLASSFGVGDSKIREPRLLPRGSHLHPRKYVTSNSPSDLGSLRGSSRSRSKSTARGISEEVVESMEI